MLEILFMGQMKAIIEAEQRKPGTPGSEKQTETNRRNDR